MRSRPIVAASVLLAFCLAALRPAGLAAQGGPTGQIVDGIVARIEDDVITLSELRELAAYQQLVDGRSQSDEDLRSELIEQWIVNNEAAGTHFPLPAATEVDREFTRIQNSFANTTAFDQRLAAVGLTQQGLRRLL